LPGDEPVVSLTFDDGPNPRATPRILDILRRARVRATFFVLGQHVERWPELVRRMALEGHQIGNHGFFHRKLHRRTPAYVRDDITRGTEAIVRASGVRPRHFRAPHGFRSPWVTPIAASLGQRTVGWSLGVWDSARPGADVIASRLIEGMRLCRLSRDSSLDTKSPSGTPKTASHAPNSITSTRRVPPDERLAWLRVLSAS